MPKPFVYMPLLLSLSIGFSNASLASDLLNIYQLVQKNYASWEAAKQQYNAQREAYSIARSVLRPQGNISLQASAQDVADDGNNPINNQTASLNLSQTLYDKPNQLASNVARQREKQGELILQGQKQQLILDTATLYFNVLRAKDNQRFAKAEQTAIEQQLEQAKSRYEVGIANITDVKDAQASRDQAYASTIAADNTLSLAKESLRVSIGKRTPTLASLSQSFPITSPTPSGIEYWLDQARNNQVSLQIQQLEQDVAALDIATARSITLPTLSLNGQLNKTNSEGNLQDSESASLGLQANWNFLTGGRRNARVRQAKALHEQQIALTYQQDRLTEQNVRQAFLNQVSAVNQVNALQEALQSTEVAYQATEAGYRVGTNTAVEVLLALREKYRAQANYSSARYDYLLSKLQLSQAIGTLDEDELAAINKWLDKT